MNYSDELLQAIRSVTAKRPRTVLEHILQHGYITTEELASLYGYNHPPRAARDVREHGIPLKTERIISNAGRSIAKYTINVEEFERRRTGIARGRRALSSLLKRRLISLHGTTCEICLTIFENDLDLQIDHRVPYQIGGDPPLSDVSAFIIVCAPCNREKSWRCEYCPNWEQRRIDVCTECFWANPSSYTHVAMRERRAVIVIFSQEEEQIVQALIEESVADGLSLSEVIKKKLKEINSSIK